MIQVFISDDIHDFAEAVNEVSSNAEILRQDHDEGRLEGIPEVDEEDLDINQVQYNPVDVF